MTEDTMTTLETALLNMREICLSLPGTSEKDHFGEAAFAVGKKMFATCGVKKGVCRIIFQLEPEHAERLLATDSRFEPYAREKHCLVLDASKVTRWDEVRDLVLESYRLTAATLPARKRTAKGTREKS